MHLVRCLSERNRFLYDEFAVAITRRLLYMNLKDSKVTFFSKKISFIADSRWLFVVPCYKQNIASGGHRHKTYDVHSINFLLYNCALLTP